MEEKLKQQPADCIKIVLFGPESTGKTTLSKQLAAHYETLWVPEFARDYLQEKWDREKKVCEPHDLLPIAIGQMALGLIAIGQLAIGIFFGLGQLATGFFCIGQTP